MLAELTLTNFRPFDDTVTIRFRPITVFIGRNSSGKSSIIKFLLMLQQSGPGSPQFLNSSGDRVDLGSFAYLKNSLTRKRNLSFKFSATSESEQLIASFRAMLPANSEFSADRLLFAAHGTVPYGKSRAAPNATYSVCDRVSGKLPFRLNPNLFAGPTFWAQGPTPDLLDDVPDPDDPDLTEEERTAHINRLQAFAGHMAGILVVTTLRHQVASLRHLTAVRDESQRVIETSSPPYDHVGQTGQYTLPHLERLLSERAEAHDFLLPYLSSVAGLQGIRFKRFGKYVSQAFANHTATGADVPIADYGFGVSQCLPVFVQGALMEPHSTLMVEQPEAQLHPTAQLEIGSYFADLWNHRRVGSIIETHSANILLRLRRLIAAGRLSNEDVSVAFFTPEKGKGSVVTNLDILPDGSMQDGLPMEFFGADVIEGLRLGART